MATTSLWISLYFYPRPPRGGRRPSNTRLYLGANFYPRPPRGGRPEPVSPPDTSERFLSTPSARGATHGHAAATRHLDISIHALREEGDWLRQPERHEQAISIHALREEGDRRCRALLVNIKKFLSTPSARRATWCVLCSRRCGEDFYPRPPRGGRPPSGS